MRVRWILPLLAVAVLWLPQGGPPAAAAEGSTYVGDDACFQCHEAADLNMGFNVHMQVESFEVLGREVGCEGCHGPGSAHAEGGDPELIRSFAEYGSAEAVCMECHATKHLPEWDASIHALEQVSCTNCHAIHTEKKPNYACAECHADSVSRFMLPSHHPVREKKMSCSSCHNAHAATEFMLNTRRRTNDLCYQCHQSKEGPFIFEHPPVVEDCSTCHLPHGSPVNNLLTANQPVLCLQCHDFHFHAGYRSSDSLEGEVGGIERENPFGPQGFNIAFTTNCTQCHSHIHGSDLPSQTTPGWGKALIP